MSSLRLIFCLLDRSLSLFHFWLQYFSDALRLSAFFFIGLAEARDEGWVAQIADFAVSLTANAKIPVTFFKLALNILLSLADSVAVQKVVFQKLWKCRQLQQLKAGGIVEVIMQASDTDALKDEACRAFYILQLQISLCQTQGGNDWLRRAEQWQTWLKQANQHEDSLYVELILRFAMQCASEPPSDGNQTWNVCPELERLRGTWGLPAEQEQQLGNVRVSLLLQHPNFWSTAIEISNKRAASLTPQLLEPLLKALDSVSQKVIDQDLTVEEMFNTAASLNAWENPHFVGLLQGRSSEELRPKLQKIIKKISFMQEFEVYVRRHLLTVFPGQGRARDLGKVLYESFLKASIDGKFHLSDIQKLSVSLGQINEDAWQRPVLLPEELELTLDDAPEVTFVSVLTAIKTLYLARSERNKPIQRMLQEVEQEMKRNGDDLHLLDTMFFLYNRIEQMLNELSGFAQGSEAGLPAHILSSIERHWAGVAPHLVSNLLREINSVTSLLRGDLDEIGRRLEAVLQGRQTVEFWNLCNRILASLSSCISNRPIREVFSEETKGHIASLQAMHRAFEAAMAQKDAKLTTADLDNVMRATQRIRGLLDGLGAGGSGFDLVLRLVTTMAEVPGLSFLKVLLSSAQKGEDLATRLTELVEGALTQDTITNVERASAVFLPLCAAALAAMDSPVDANKFGPMVDREWSKPIQTSALQARSKGEIGDLMQSMLLEAHRKQGGKLPDFFEALRSALRQGQVVAQKLQENTDDATAVSNTVSCMVTSGYFELTPGNDAMHFEVTGVFEFSKDQETITRDVHQLTECSDKASLAVPKGAADVDNPTALTQEKVRVFTGCVEGILGLRQELTELLQIGHPYLEDLHSLRFPSKGKGLSESTLQDLKENLRWAQHATQQWCSVLDRARERHPIMSCIPARNITKVARAILQNEPPAVIPLMSLDFRSKINSFQEEESLDEAFQQCKFFLPREGAHEDFLEQLVHVLSQVVPGEAMTSFSALHDVAKLYPKNRGAHDATAKSIMEQQRKERRHPKFYPKRVMLIQEEKTHETASDLQSTASTTVLSLLLPLGVGPSPENILLCDSSTTKDDILRFLHRLKHATRMALDTSYKAQVLGVFVHVDCLRFDVLQVLMCRVDAMQAAVGRRKEADTTAEIEVLLAFTLTRRAPKTLIESLEKDLCMQQKISILKLSTIQRFLGSKDAKAALGSHQVVSSDFAGDGKTHAIRRASGWNQASHATIVWGGAQTRGQAAKALRKAEGAGSIHLEVHSFEEGGGVDADMLLMELLLLRCVFDPERSEWTRLPFETPIFLEVANSIKINQGPQSDQLMMMSAPILKGVPGEQRIDATFHFVFDGSDLHPKTASAAARSFALAGAALLLPEDSQRLVGGEDENGVVFKLMTDAEGKGTECFWRR